MRKIELGSFKEQYQYNKKQMIKSKNGKIVSMQLLEELKSKKQIINFNVEMSFEVEKSIQKIVFNQGILLPYRFSKFIEKAKFNLFHAKEIGGMTEEELNVSFYGLNLLINYEIKQLLSVYDDNSQFELMNISLN
jgi:hypothetical protein